MSFLFQIATFAQDIELISRRPEGLCRNVFHENEFLYIQNGGAIQVLDASNPSDIKLKSQFIIDAVPLRIFVENSIVYIATEDDGYIILDASDKSNLKRANQLQFDWPAKSVFVKDNYAFLAAGYNGLLIYDVTDPYDIKKISTFEGLWDAKDAVVKDTLIYILDHPFFKVYSVADIYNPYEITVHDSTFLTDMEFIYGWTSLTVDSSFAYVAHNNDLFTIDINNPRHPELFSILNFDSIIWHVTGNSEYISVSTFDVISYMLFQKNPSGSLSLKAQMEYEGKSFRSSLSEKYAFIACENKLQIFDTETSKDVGEYQTGVPIWRSGLANQKLYISGRDQILTYNISNPANLELETQHRLDHNIYLMETDSEYIYTAGVKSLKVYKLEENNVLNLISAINLDGLINCMKLKGNKLYVCTSFKEKLITIDITDKYSPFILNQSETRRGFDFTLANQIGYLALGYDGVSIWDFSNETAPKIISEIPINSATRLFHVNAHLFIGHEDGVSIYNVADSQNPVFVSSYACGSITDFKINDKIIYLCEYPNKFTVLEYDETYTTNHIYTYETGNIANGLQLNNNIIYVTDGKSGIYIFKHDKTTNLIERIENKKYSLRQNYPNPFNPVTTIKYTIPNLEFRHQNSEPVTLHIYDILGNEISTLVNREQQAGTYEVEWNAANLPSGIYLYKLAVGNFVETRKMILIK